MADQTVYEGDEGRVNLDLFDLRGLEGARWDQVQNPSWYSSHPDSIKPDEGAKNPVNARVSFEKATPPGEEAYIEFRCDSIEGANVNELVLRSETYEVKRRSPDEDEEEKQVDMRRVDPHSPTW